VYFINQAVKNFRRCYTNDRNDYYDCVYGIIMVYLLRAGKNGANEYAFYSIEASCS